MSDETKWLRVIAPDGSKSYEPFRRDGETLTNASPLAFDAPSGGWGPAISVWIVDPETGRGLYVDLLAGEAREMDPSPATAIMMANSKRWVD